MRERRSISTERALTILVVAAIVTALTGCGIGRATTEEKISKTAVTYLKALADGDTTKACEQLTRRAQGEGCAAAMKERRRRLDPDALNDAADDSMDIDVADHTATAGLSKPEGARFVLAEVAGQWRIDSGYTLD